MADHRLYAPATERNRDPILAVLRGVLPPRGTVLEIASGSGEHVVYFAQNFPNLAFQPSDPSPDSAQSIAAWIAATRVGNVRAPVILDTTQLSWPVKAADAILCINMIHIAPWSAAEGLFAGAASLLAPGAPLYLYGPYKRDGAHTAPSNVDFDRGLRERNPAWGVRDLDDVASLARKNGFSAPTITAMPANNLSVVFRRSGPA